MGLCVRCSRLGHVLGFRCCVHWVPALGWGLLAAFSTAFASEPCGTGTYPFPYTDVASVGDPFCPGIMEAYVTGVSKGTTPTTFSPNNTVTRVQMTTFLQRSLDQELERTSRRAALNLWATPQTTAATQTIAVGGNAQFCAADGETIWVSNNSQVVQVQASTGKVLGTWTGAASSAGIVVAAGKVFVSGSTGPPNNGMLYLIDPTLAPGAVTVANNNLGIFPLGITFDGTHLWTANNGSSVSIITPQATIPYPVTTVSTGFIDLRGIVYDGTHIWVTDAEANALYKLSAAGAILQTVTTGIFPEYPAFDGANIWVPNYTDSTITVVQASTGSIVATISPDATNQLNNPHAASFDGQHILVTNFNSVTIFKAADLSVVANIATVPSLFGACSDGVNLWVTTTTGNLLRF
jgi:hypothetical protein